MDTKKINKVLAKNLGSGFTAVAKDDEILLEGNATSFENYCLAAFLAAEGETPQAIPTQRLINNIHLPHEISPKIIAPKYRDKSLEGKNYDVVIVGAGVLGCATARLLSQYRIRVLLLDKENDVALHASANPYAIMRAGVGLAEGTLKHKYNTWGNRLIANVCDELNVPFYKTGGYLLFDDDVKQSLTTSKYTNKYSGIAQKINKKTLHEDFPFLQKDLTAIYMPSIGVVNGEHLTIAMAENAIQNGVQLSLNTIVNGFTVDNEVITAVHTNKGTVIPRIVINCAGTFCEHLAKMANDHFYGTYTARATVGEFNVPENHTFIAQSAATQGEVGAAVFQNNKAVLCSNAVLTAKRENASCHETEYKSICEQWQTAIPSLKNASLANSHVGLLTHSYEDDYIVANGKYTKNIIHAAGIGEGGFTASTAIALDLVDMAINMLDSAVQKTRLYNPNLEKPINFNSLDFSEKSALISKDVNYSKVICKCNNITRGDIVSALKGSVPCESVQAVMRRTNAGKGLCNGSHCALEIAKIISEETHLPLRFVLLSGDYSELGGLLV